MQSLEDIKAEAAAAIEAALMLRRLRSCVSVISKEGRADRLAKGPGSAVRRRAT